MNRNDAAQLYLWPIFALLTLDDMARDRAAERLRQSIAAEGGASLLEGGTQRLIRIHAVANKVVQRACASFVLYRIYQDMFRRGRQERLTHAVVFNEAHRASRLLILA